LQPTQPPLSTTVHTPKNPLRQSKVAETFQSYHSGLKYKPLYLELAQFYGGCWQDVISAGLVPYGWA
ncbi:MAG: hypothetical protein KDE54_02135, partial [Caldilineaceae bacterium]|nr:hypothetical protein [Caldilineaceae bacterium]